jgi:iron complex transport system permease protein
MSTEMLKPVTLDLPNLVASGAMSSDEATRLMGMATTGRAVSVLVQVLSIFGALGLAAGVVALKPEPIIGLILGIVALGFAAFVQATNRVNLSVLGTGMALAGTLGICGWFATEYGTETNALLINTVTTLFVLASALWFRSLFLIALVPIGVASMLGSGTMYWHASYGIFVQESFLTILVFGIGALLLFALSYRLPSIRGMQALIAARVSWIIMNFGFWVGSLWGDHIGDHFYEYAAGARRDYSEIQAWREAAFFIPDYAFVVAWALASIATIIWLKRHRFAVNAGITFLAINGYTQFFERFHESAWALIWGGGSLLVFAWALFNFDRYMQAKLKAETTTR